MDNVTKEHITELLRKYCEEVGSLNKASQILTGTSRTTLHSMLHKNWDNITMEMWRNVGKQVGWQADGWTTVETTNLNLLNFFFEDARQNANVFGVIADAGSGKTEAAKIFSQRENVFLLRCNEYFNRKSFLIALLKAMGKDSAGYTTTELMEQVITYLLRADHPLIILDEADKLNDSCLYFFITFYNDLEDKCGIVMMATDHLAKKIDRGIRLNKMGYKEIFSRLGRRWIELPKPSKKDVANIMRANGLEDDITISETFNDSEGDLRRVKRLVHSKRRELETRA